MNYNFEDELDRKGQLIYRNIGNSMMPLLREKRDLFVIEKNSGSRYKKYDVVLYRRANGQYVLHRILRVRKEDYVMCGDHQYHREYGVEQEQILGGMTKVIRDGKTTGDKDLKYCIYVHLWCDFFYIRCMILWIKAKTGRIFNEAK